jgi:hypothetical protein
LAAFIVIASQRHFTFLNGHETNEKKGLAKQDLFSFEG